MEMLKKCADVVHKEYREWAEDEGEAQPILQDDKDKEIKQNFVPDPELYGLGSRGMRVA
jgi:hypothetical protein